MFRKNGALTKPSYQKTCRIVYAKNMVFISTIRKFPAQVLLFITTRFFLPSTFYLLPFILKSTEVKQQGETQGIIERTPLVRSGHEVREIHPEDIVF